MFAQRLGLPHLQGAGSFVIATLMDTLGTGLFLPFSLLLCWLLGTSVLRKRLIFRTDVPSSQYRGFRFLKDPLFLASSVFVKKPERIMALRFRSPILQLGRMDFILRGDLRKRLLFLQEFLNHFCLESC